MKNKLTFKGRNIYVDQMGWMIYKTEKDGYNYIKVSYNRTLKPLKSPKLKMVEEFISDNAEVYLKDYPGDSFVLISSRSLADFVESHFHFDKQDVYPLSEDSISSVPTHVKWHVSSIKKVFEKGNYNLLVVKVKIVSNYFTWKIAVTPNQLDFIDYYLGNDLLFHWVTSFEQLVADNNETYIKTKFSNGTYIEDVFGINHENDVFIVTSSVSIDYF